MSAIIDIVGDTQPSLEEIEKHAETLASLARSEERQRISQIIGHGIETDCLADALMLAFQSELPAVDAISIIDAKQTADVIRPN